MPQSPQEQGHEGGLGSPLLVHEPLAKRFAALLGDSLAAPTELLVHDATVHSTPYQPSVHGQAGALSGHSQPAQDPSYLTNWIHLDVASVKKLCTCHGGWVLVSNLRPSGVWSNTCNTLSNCSDASPQSVWQQVVARVVCYGDISSDQVHTAAVFNVAGTLEKLPAGSAVACLSPLLASNLGLPYRLVPFLQQRSGSILLSGIRLSVQPLSAYLSGLVKQPLSHGVVHAEAVVLRKVGTPRLTNMDLGPVSAKPGTSVSSGDGLDAMEWEKSGNNSALSEALPTAVQQYFTSEPR